MMRVAGEAITPAKPGKRGRKKGSVNKSKAGEAAVAQEPNETKRAKTGATQKKQMSPEGRARIAAAQKARWAAKKDTTSQTKASTEQAEKAPKTRKTMSPEAREKIAAAQKARWAAKKDAGE